MTPGPMVGSVAVTSLPETSAPYCSPHGSTLAPNFGANLPTFTSSYPPSKSPLFQPTSQTMGMSQLGYSVLQANPMTPVYPGTGMVPSSSFGGSPPMGFNMTPDYGGVGMVQSGSLVGNPMAGPLFLGESTGQSSVFGGNWQEGVLQLGRSTPQAGGGVSLQEQLNLRSGSGETANNNNPFLI